MTALSIALLLALALTIGLIAVTAYGYRTERREVTRLRARARDEARDTKPADDGDTPPQ